jgi:type VI protein secretion system component VasF
MDKSFHNVSDLPEASRSAVEAMVGHPLQRDDVLYIATIRVENKPASAERDAAWNELMAIIADMHQHVAASGMTPEQIDALIDSECEAVRYGRSE